MKGVGPALRLSQVIETERFLGWMGLLPAIRWGVKPGVGQQVQGQLLLLTRRTSQMGTWTAAQVRFPLTPFFAQNG